MAYVQSKAANGRSQRACLARRGTPRRPCRPRLALEQIREQLGRAVDRVMAKGSLYDPDLAALAIKQAQGDLIEAAFCCAPIAPRCRALPMPVRSIRRDAGGPPHLGHFQGPAGRANPGPDL